MNFSAFQTIILRTPVYPVNYYIALLQNYSREKLFETIGDSHVKNAIALATPELLSQIEKYNQNPEKFTVEKGKHLEQSLLKYIARMCSRSTPFGLFAGCTTGTLGKETKIELASKDCYSTHNQFDMQFWIALLQTLAKDEEIKSQLRYFPNTSLYSVGSFYRYTEYTYTNKKREHSIAAIRKNESVTRILEKAQQGCTIEALVAEIIESDLEKEEATIFVNKLIDNQILVSNLEATITGDMEMQRVIALLEAIPEVAEKTKAIKKAIHTLTANYDVSVLKNVQNQIEKVTKEYDAKYLLQTDLYTHTTTNTINKKNVQKLKQAIAFLAKTQQYSANRNLEQFKKAFLKRYETKEMPLSMVLDVEIGIGYLQNSNEKDSHPILDLFTIAKETKEIAVSELWTKWSYTLEEKVQTCLAKEEGILILNDDDVKDFEAYSGTLPATFSAMIEIINIEEREMIVLESLGNFSAAKLIGRFCNGNENIHKLAKEIIAKEKELNEDAVLAEIAHIPESRTGNILKRPVLRDYEIPYLANSNMEKENQIALDDLYISIVQNTIVLKSKRLNKRIIPCLSNAHNYTNSSLPIYQFLCDLQGQAIHPVYRFNWGVLKGHYNYFPQVRYKDVILAKARWYVYYDDLKNQQFNSDFENWKQKNKIPKYITIVSGDNTLLLDLEKEISFDILVKTAKTKNKVVLEEFLFTTNNVVQDIAENQYTNQVILSFFKEKVK